MARRRTTIALSLLCLAGLAHCGGGTALPPPEHTLMNRTAAGEGRCPITKSHERPFVIEWDATDLASFEAKAAHDVVFVRYEGCSLSVLECSDSGLRGKLGAYRAPEWTSGTVEGFDMHTEGELYAQLPLGAASLSGRIEAGEALQLRYFVSGVASATRDAIYRAELPKRCEGATHFVQAYNLGAFELASSARNKGSVSAKAGGFGGGGSQSQASSILKHGGEIDACRDEATRTSKRCQVPIRIALRAIEAGAPPADAPPASTAPAPGGGGTNALLEAGKLRNAAQDKSNDGDAVACLRDLDRAREIDPDPEHEKFVGQLRAQCTMKTGKCEAGKDMLRAYFRAFWGKAGTPEAIEGIVKTQSAQYCTGKN